MMKSKNSDGITVEGDDMPKAILRACKPNDTGVHIKLLFENENFLIYPIEYQKSLDAIHCFTAKPVIGFGMYLIDDIFNKADENGYEVVIETCSKKEVDIIRFLFAKFQKNIGVE